MITPDFRNFKGAGEQELMHSYKGTTWKKHKYIRKEGKRYVYPAIQIKEKPSVLGRLTQQAEHRQQGMTPNETCLTRIRSKFTGDQLKAAEYIAKTKTSMGGKTYYPSDYVDMNVKDVNLAGKKIFLVSATLQDGSKMAVMVPKEGLGLRSMVGESVSNANTKTKFDKSYYKPGIDRKFTEYRRSTTGTKSDLTKKKEERNDRASSRAGKRLKGALLRR